MYSKLSATWVNAARAALSIALYYLLLLDRPRAGNETREPSGQEPLRSPTRHGPHCSG